MPQNGTLILIASMLLMIVLGSVHAFSVFLAPLESQFSASRSSVSLTYSFALVTLTTAVLFGHRVYERLRPAAFMVLVCLLSAVGTLIAAFASQLWVVWLGYSVLFGGANGLGYGYALQISAQANPRQQGVAMGLVTASYALGATLAPWPLVTALNEYGFAMAMLGLSVASVIVLPVIALTYQVANAQLSVPKGEPPVEVGQHQRRRIFLHWLAYGSAVTAGLMAIGHATGIAEKGRVNEALILAAPMVLAGFNMVGSFFGGWMTDRVHPRLLLMTLAGISALCLFSLSQLAQGVWVLVGLAITGFIYGAIIAVYPAVINRQFGAKEGMRVYGKVFTAWGFAGLFGPWLAGRLFDVTADYTTALLVAAGAGLLSVCMAYWSFRD